MNQINILFFILPGNQSLSNILQSIYILTYSLPKRLYLNITSMYSHYIAEGLKQKLYVNGIIVFIDIARAFDKPWRQNLNRRHTTINKLPYPAMFPFLHIFPFGIFFNSSSFHGSTSMALLRRRDKCHDKSKQHLPLEETVFLQFISTTQYSSDGQTPFSSTACKNKTDP